MKKIYIAGAGGMLGEAFYRVFKENFDLKCTDIDVNEDWIEFLDFRDFFKYQKDVADFRPDYLFHLGAHTNLEYCEKNPEDAYITNTLSVENAVFIANSLDIPLLYIGTAGIFGGDKDFYDDWDLPSPLSVYARSKFAAEVFVQQNVRKHLICRAGWMMGGGFKKDKKFINKIISQLAIDQKELYVVNDRLGTPTYTYDFARNVELLIHKEYWGLYNMVCSGFTSRLEVVREILDILKIEDVSIVEVASDYFQAEYFAHRPSSERLVNMKLDLRGLNIMRKWQIGLKEYLHEQYSGIIRS